MVPRVLRQPGWRRSTPSGAVGRGDSDSGGGRTAGVDGRSAGVVGVGGGARRERSVSDSEPDFPFWALPDDHLPVEFALKKSVKFVG